MSVNDNLRAPYPSKIITNAGNGKRMNHKRKIN